MDEGRIKEKFINKFRRLQGFQSLTPFIDSSTGFSVVKKFKNSKTKLSLIKVSLQDNDGTARRRIYVRAAFGRLDKDRSALLPTKSPNRLAPIDIESVGEYFYDPLKDLLYEGDEVTTAQKIMDKFYSEHIKSTKVFVGAPLRLRLVLQVKMPAQFFRLVEKVSHFLLLIFSGERFSWNPFFQNESTNSSAQGGAGNGSPDDKPPKTLSIFGYEASRWAVVVYALINLAVYTLFVEFNFKPRILSRLIENNFLTVMYVVLSLGLIDFVLPRCLKYLIKLASNRAAEYPFKKIKI